MNKIWGVLSVLAGISGTIDLGDRIVKAVGGFDMRIFLEITLIIIFVVSCSMYLHEKYKGIKGKYISDLTERDKKMDELKTDWLNSFESLEKSMSNKYTFLSDRIDRKQDKPITEPPLKKSSFQRELNIDTKS